MYLECEQYEWELEGDLAASVWLKLAFTAATSKSGIESLSLIEVDPIGVTFAMKGDDIVCDGSNNGFGRKPNSLLPTELLSWFSSRFLEEWTTNPRRRDEMKENLKEQAIQKHYEALAAA